MGFSPDAEQAAPEQQIEQAPVARGSFTPDVAPRPKALTAAEIPGGDKILAENNAWLSNVTTPEMISEWEGQGTIGVGEAFQRLDKWEMLPVLNGKTLLDDIAVVQSFNAFKNGEFLSNDDKAQIKDFVLDMAEVQTRGYTIGGRITDGALRMPAYIGEMALAVGITGLTFGTGAVPSFGAVAAKGTAKASAKVGAKEFAKIALKKGTQAATVASVGTGTVMLPRVAKKGINDHLNDSIAITDKGKVFIENAERAPAEYALRAAASVFVENFAELAGGELIRPVVRAGGKQVARVLPEKFVTGFNKLLTKTQSERLRKAGFSGILEEIGEERLTDLLITSFDLDPERGYTSEQFLSAMFPDREDFLVEAGIITLVGGTSRAAVGVRNELRKRGVSEKEIDLTLENMSELEKDTALASFNEIAKKTPEAQLESATVELETLEDTDFSQLEPEQIDSVIEQIDRKIIEVDQLQSVVDQKLLEISDIQPEPIAGKPVRERIAFLNKELSSIDKGIESLALKINQNIEKEKPTAALEEKLDKAIEKRVPLAAEVENLRDEGLLKVLDPDFTERKIITKQGAIDKALFKERERGIRQFKTAFKEGVRAAKKDVKAVQKVLKKAIDDTNLSDKNKKKFTNRIIETQTIEQLQKKAPGIEQRIEELLNAEALAKQKAVLKKELSHKAIKATVVSGKKTGKFTAEIQVRLQELREASSLNAINAQTELSNRIFSDGAQDVLVNSILNIKANPLGVSASDIAGVVAEVKAIKILGVALAESRRTGRKLDAKDVRDNIIGHIQSIDPKSATRKPTGFLASGRSLRQFGRSAVSLIGGSWNELIDRVAPKSMAGVLGVRREVSRAKQIKRVMQEKLTLAADTAFGTNGDAKKLTAELVESDRIVPLGTFKNLNGEEVTLDLSRSQARKLWMAVQSPDILEKTIQAETGNAYTDEMLEAAFSILDRDKGDYDFAQAQLDIYAEFYDDINEVYSRVFGIDLPRVEFYSPIAREADQGDINKDVFLRDIDTRRALATGSAIHIRDANASSAIVLKTDIDAYAAHANEMANFIAFREKTMLLEAVFGNAQLRKKIELTFGSAVNAEIKDTMGAIAGVNKVQTNALEKSVNYLNRNSATSVLGLKAKIGLTQLASFPSYAETIPTKAFLSGTADFFLNFEKAISILSKSELVRDRGANEDVDIARMGKTFDSRFIKKVKDRKANLIDYTLIFTKFGDRAAIYVGGWSVYKHAIDTGKTHEQAIAAFEAATADTQQSKDVDQLSFFQRQNAITRGLVMFMSAPIAQFRGEVRVVRRFQKGEASVQELAKGLIIYHVLIPQIYTALANGIIAGEVDGEDQFRALMLGSLAGIPLIGDAINAAFRSAQGKGNQPKEALKAMKNIVEAMENSFNAMNSGKEGDYEEAIEALVDLSKNAANIVGLPVAGAEGIISGIQDIAEDDVTKGALKVSGFPKSVSGK